MDAEECYGMQHYSCASWVVLIMESALTALRFKKSNGWNSNGLAADVEFVQGSHNQRVHRTLHYVTVK